MATYDYICENEDCEVHNLIFEVEQSMSDDKLTTCPDCKQETLKRVVSSGGGFRIGGIGVHKPTSHWGS